MGLAIGIALSASELTNYFAQTLLPVASTDYGVGSSLLLACLFGIGALSITVLASALDAWGNDQLPKAPRRSIFSSNVSKDNNNNNSNKYDNENHNNIRK